MRACAPLGVAACRADPIGFAAKLGIAAVRPVACSHSATRGLARAAGVHWLARQGSCLGINAAVPARLVRLKRPR